MRNGRQAAWYNAVVKRIGRYILNALTVLSLVLCLGTLGLWESASNRTRGIKFQWTVGAREIDITCFHDVAYVYVTSRSAILTRTHVHLNSLHLWGMRYDYDLLSAYPLTAIYRRSVDIYYWLPSCIFAVLPASRVLLRLRTHCIKLQRSRTGRCQACGYDLRATPDRCPECGTMPIKSEKISN